MAKDGGFMKSIKWMVISTVLLLTLLLFAVQTASTVINFNSIVTGDIKSELKTNVEKEAYAMYAQFSELGEASSSYASVISSLKSYDADVLFGVLEKYLTGKKLIVGGGFWLEPDEFEKGKKYYGPYLYKDGSEIKLTWDYSTDAFNYFQYDWYKDGMSTGQEVVWSEPYADSVTGVPMITATSAIKKQDKKVGVVTLDVGLEELQKSVSEIKIGKGGQAFMITKQGFYLANKDTKNNLTKKITDEADVSIKQLGNSIINGKQTGISNVKIDNEDSMVVFTPIGDTGIKLVMTMPVAEVYESLQKAFISNTLIFILAIMVFIILLSRIFSVNIIKPLNLLIQDAKMMAEGDFTNDGKLLVYGSKKHEIGQLTRVFIDMGDNIKKLIVAIRNSADMVYNSCKELEQVSSAVSTSSEQISTTVSELAGGISQQAETTQDASERVKSIILSIDKVNENAGHSQKLTEEAVDVMEKSAIKVKEQKTKMQESKDAVLNVSNVINSLSDNSKQIGDIINTIDSIASQTNLLSLNAAIEAARAGEQGRGFAVVAEEIRKLAEQSSNATHSINDLIKDIQQYISQAVEEMNKSVSIVEEQETSVEETVLAFESLIGSIETVSKNINGVSGNSALLNKDANAVVAMIENLASIAEESSAGTEEVAASTEHNTVSIQKVSQIADNLSGLAQVLEDDVNRFKI